MLSYKWRSKISELVSTEFPTQVLKDVQLTSQKWDEKHDGGAEGASHDEDDALLRVRVLGTVQLKENTVDNLLMTIGGHLMRLLCKSEGPTASQRLFLKDYQ